MAINYDRLGYHILILQKHKVFYFSVTKVSNSVSNSLFHTVYTALKQKHKAFLTLCIHKQGKIYEFHYVSHKKNNNI